MSNRDVDLPISTLKSALTFYDLFNFVFEKQSKAERCRDRPSTHWFIPPIAATARAEVV